MKRKVEKNCSYIFILAFCSVMKNTRDILLHWIYYEFENDIIGLVYLIVYFVRC